MRLQPKWLRALGRSQDAVYVVNSAQRIVCWNAGAQKLLGYSEGEVLNQPCYQVLGGSVYGKSWCRAGCAVQRSARRGILLRTFEMKVIARNGREVWLSASVFTVERRRRRYAIHLLRDMTREEQTKEALEGVLDTLQAYGVSDGDHESARISGLPIHTSSFHSPSLAQLTRREIEVLELLAQGLSTSDLAKRLGVSPFTVRSHVESILLKTGLHTQAQAVAYAYRAGLL